MEETLQAIFAEIALIKEFICEPTNEETEYQMLRTFDTNISFALFLEQNEKLILVSSSRARYLSTEFDALGLQFARYPYGGYGRINQAFFNNGRYHFKEWKNLDSQSTAYKIEKYCNYFHLTPYPDTSHTIEVWGKPA